MEGGGAGAGLRERDVFDVNSGRLYGLKFRAVDDNLLLKSGQFVRNRKVFERFSIFECNRWELKRRLRVWGQFQGGL